MEGKRNPRDKITKQPAKLTCLLTKNDGENAEDEELIEELREKLDDPKLDHFVAG